MGEKNRTTPSGRGTGTDEFNPADEAQKRQHPKEVDKRDDGMPDEHEKTGRRLLGKRHT